MCAPPEGVRRAAGGAGVPMVPAGPSVRELMRGVQAEGKPPDLPRLAAEMIAAQFDGGLRGGEGCDAIVAGGISPAAAAARSVADQLGIRYVYATYCPVFLPSPHHRPLGLPGRPIPPEVTDNRALWDLDAEGLHTSVRPTAQRPPGVGRPAAGGQRPRPRLHRPAVAGGGPDLGPWPQPADLDVVQTGAWILPDERPLPADAGGVPRRRHAAGLRRLRQHPHARCGGCRPGRDRGGPRARPPRLVSGGWAELALIDEGDDCLAVGEVNQQALFARVAAVVHHGGAGTTTAAARAGAPQVVVPQIGDQPYWAGRVAELGIGAAHDGPTPTFESLSAALATALTPETAHGGGRGRPIRTDGAAVAARLLLDGSR